MSEPYLETLHRVTHIIKQVSLLGPDKNIQPDTNLFSERILDSVMLIDLLNRVEDEFSIKFTTKEFIPENFSSTDKLTLIILKIKNEKPQ